MKRDYVTPIVALVLLAAMVTFSITGDRDDKAWEFAVKQIEGWTDFD